MEDEFIRGFSYKCGILCIIKMYYKVCTITYFYLKISNLIQHKFKRTKKAVNRGETIALEKVNNNHKIMYQDVV